MKLLCCILTVTACSLLGQYLTRFLHTRVKALEAVLVMLQDIRMQLEFLALPVEDLLDTLCERDCLTRLGFLQECRLLLHSGMPFPKAWKTACEKSVSLRREDLERLIAFGEVIGTTDLPGQLASCSLYTQLLNENLSAAREDFRSYGKLLPALGLCGGLALAIVWI